MQRGGPSKRGTLFVARRRMHTHNTPCVCWCVSACVCVHEKKGGIFSPHHARQCRLSFADSLPFPSPQPQLRPPCGYGGSGLASSVWPLAGPRVSGQWDAVDAHLLLRDWPLYGRAFLLGTRSCAQSSGLGFGSGFGFLHVLPHAYNFGLYSDLFVCFVKKRTCLYSVSRWNLVRAAEWILKLKGCSWGPKEFWLGCVFSSTCENAVVTK